MRSSKAKAGAKGDFAKMDVLQGLRERRALDALNEQRSVREATREQLVQRRAHADMLRRELMAMDKAANAGFQTGEQLIAHSEHRQWLHVDHAAALLEAQRAESVDQEALRVLAERRAAWTRQRERTRLLNEMAREGERQSRHRTSRRLERHTDDQVKAPGLVAGSMSDG